MKDKMIKWYKDSFNKYGRGDYRSLTWGDKEGKSARKRYEQMSQYVDFKNSSVHEVGCGWGSFFNFGFKCKEYYGIDIIKDFVDIANEKYNNASIKFKTSGLNIVDKKFDIAIASGVAGNRGGPACTPSELNKFLKYMLDSANLTMINFPSIYATIRSDIVEYFSPEYLLSSSLRFTDNVEIIHKHKFDVLLIMRR